VRPGSFRARAGGTINSLCHEGGCSGFAGRGIISGGQSSIPTMNIDGSGASTRIRRCGRPAISAICASRSTLWSGRLGCEVEGRRECAGLRTCPHRHDDGQEKSGRCRFCVDGIRRRGYEFRNSRIGIAPGADVPGVSFCSGPPRSSTIAVATASSKKLLAPISAEGAATQWATPSWRLSR
jgi:hypothetical protein